MTNVDQAMVWLDILCKGHDATDVDQATVWPDVPFGLVSVVLAHEG